MNNARRKVRKSLLAIVCGVLVALLLAEVVLRVVLFHADASFLRAFRNPECFAQSNADDDYWKLQRLLTRPEQRRPVCGMDAVVGWTGPLVAPDTYEHVRDVAPDGRRLVLLYGDSFSACATGEPTCFPALLERSDLGSRFRMLNYGVGGYGLDQIYLLLRRSVDRYRDQDPFVIVGMLVENDLDRAILSVRDWPKPRLDVTADGLVQREPVIDFESYLERRPIEIRSYLARFLAHRSSWMPAATRAWLRGDRRRIEEKKALCGRILAEIHGELESRGLEHAFLLFHSDGALEPVEWAHWQEPFVRETCASIGARVVSTRGYLLAACGGVPAASTRFYIHSGPSVGHLTEVGNALSFEAMRDLLEGRPEGASTAAIEERAARGRLAQLVEAEHGPGVLGRPAKTRTESSGAFVRESTARVPPFETWTDRHRICIRPDGESATALVVDLTPRARRFVARARAITYPSADGAAGTVILEIDADGELRMRAEIAVGDGEATIDVDLERARELSISVRPMPSTPPNTWLCLSDPVLE